MSAARILVVAALCLATAHLGSCDWLRPAGKTRVPLDEKQNLVRIDAGWFVFGGRPSCLSVGCDDYAEAETVDNLIPWRLVYLSGYQIERREVTNAEYLECVQDGACDYAGCYVDVELVAEMTAGLYTELCPLARDEVALEPVRNVPWEQAKQYCQWRYRSPLASLPTEAQWEKAAVGPAESGACFDEPPLAMEDIPAELSCEVLVQSVGDSCVRDPQYPDNPMHDSGPHPFSVLPYEDGAPDPDGSWRRAQYHSPYNAIDMSGNVAEWVLDASDRADEFYCSGQFYRGGFEIEGSCEEGGALPRDCGSLETQLPEESRYYCNPRVGDKSAPNKQRVVKGGSYATAHWCDLTPRARVFASEPSEEIGFRCAIWDDGDSERGTECSRLGAEDAPGSTCAARPDAGADAGVDAGGTDAGGTDAGGTDTASPDAGAPDAAEDAAADI